MRTEPVFLSRREFNFGRDAESALKQLQQAAPPNPDFAVGGLNRAGPAPTVLTNRLRLLRFLQEN